MGERSQIFVRYEDFSGHKILAARYFQYNSDASMVSRARGILDWLKRLIRNAAQKILFVLLTLTLMRKTAR